MKEKFTKKYNNIPLLLIISLLSIVIPSGIVSANNSICLSGNCATHHVSATAGATSDVGHCRDGCPKPAGGADRFPNVSGNEITSLYCFKDANGNVLSCIADDYRDKAVLIDSGISEDLIKTSDDFAGISLPTGSIENADVAKSWKEYFDKLEEDFAKLDENGNSTINPDSEAYKLGVALGIYTGDVATDTENLLNGNTTKFSVETGATIIIDGQEMIVTSSNVDQVCAKYIDNYSNSAAGDMGSYCRAVKNSVGEFTDAGEYTCEDTCLVVAREKNPDASDREIYGICCLQEKGTSAEYGECCMFFHTPEECEAGATCEKEKKLKYPTLSDETIKGLCCVEEHQNESDPTGYGGSCCTYYHENSYCNAVTPPDPEEGKCKINTTTFYPTPPKTKNMNYNFSSGCGGMATKTEYEYNSTCEGLVTYETKKVTTISLPALNSSVYYAGQTFNWDNIKSSTIVETILFDTTPLNNRIGSLKNQIANMEAQIDYMECQKDQPICVLKGNTDQDLESYNGCLEHAEEAHQNRNNSIDEAISNIRTSDAYKEAQSNIEKYEKCLVDAGKTKSTRYTTTGLYSLSSSYIYFSGTDVKYNANEVVAIEKNSGKPLLQIDMTDEVIEKKAYLTVQSDFYVPADINNGTTLVAHRDIADISYECTAKVTNAIFCTDNGCPIIYRPISLTNPFPTVDTASNYRQFGANWSEELADAYILNNRNVSSYDVYHMTPLYTIVLTPAKIKDIREYNNTHSYNNFELTCEDGYRCMSDFLWKDFDGIVDVNNSCASANGWDIACYSGGVSE